MPESMDATLFRFTCSTFRCNSNLSLFHLNNVSMSSDSDLVLLLDLRGITTFILLSCCRCRTFLALAVTCVLNWTLNPLLFACFCRFASASIRRCCSFRLYDFYFVLGLLLVLSWANCSFSFSFKDGGSECMTIIAVVPAPLSLRVEICRFVIERSSISVLSRNDCVSQR